MRKWICLLLIAFELGCVIPQIGAAENSGEYGYSSIIAQYRQAVQNARDDAYDWPSYTFDWAPLSNVHINAYLGLVGSVQDYFGYAFRDLNADRQPELFLMIKQYKYDNSNKRWVDVDHPTYAIVAICTLIDGKTPVWCWVGGYGNDGIGDDICCLNADGSLTLVKADAFAKYVITYGLNVSGNELIPLNEIGWDLTEQNETVFYKRSGTGQKIPISKGEYENSPLWPKNYAEKHGGLVFIPLFEGRTSRGSSGVNINNGTGVAAGMFEGEWPAVYAKLNQKMATRTGPGTKYTEDHGTWPASTEIVVYAQENSGGTPWALVEFMRNGKLVRAYTGMKRIDAGTAGIPSATREPRAAAVTRETQAYYGPGTAYMAVPNPVAAGTEVLVYGVDRGYALIDYTTGFDQWMRSWVPEACIEFR